MVASYQILPTTDPELPREGKFPFVDRIYSAYNVSCSVCRAHADALDAAWLIELERLGGPVFTCFMLLRLGLLSLSIFWGFLFISPFWFLSFVSNERYMPVAVQTGLVITFIIIIEPLPFVGLMGDPRSKIFHVLYSAYLVLAWREIAVYLTQEEALGQFVALPWVRDIFYTIAGAAALGCGVVGWTIWDGLARRLWVLITLISVLFLYITYGHYKMDGY